MNLLCVTLFLVICLYVIESESRSTGDNRVIRRRKGSGGKIRKIVGKRRKNRRRKSKGKKRQRKTRFRKKNKITKKKGRTARKRKACKETNAVAAGPPVVFEGSKKCTYTFTSTTATVFKLSCSEFNVKETNKCKKAYMWVKSGSDKLGKFCGSNSPDLTTTTAGTSLVVKTKYKGKKNKISFTCQVSVTGGGGGDCSSHTCIPCDSHPCCYSGMPNSKCSPPVSPPPPPCRNSKCSPPVLPSPPPPTVPPGGGGGGGGGGGVSPTPPSGGGGGTNSNCDTTNPPVTFAEIGVTQPTSTICGNTAASFYKEITKGDKLIVVTSGVPNHPHVPRNPNEACETWGYYEMPLKPTKGTTFNEHPMGPVGSAISGAYLFNHVSNPTGVDDVAAISEASSFDDCKGHAERTGQYHYHEAPVCIPGYNTCAKMGYISDGFAVYGLNCKDSSGAVLKSCYKLKSGQDNNKDDTSSYSYEKTADCHLDMANGYDFGGEKGYAYVFSVDYPFIMAGYYGTTVAPRCSLTK